MKQLQSIQIKTIAIAALSSLLLFSCRSFGNRNPEAKEISFKITDSIPLYNDSLSFRFFDISKIAHDSILAFQHPALNLSLLNHKGVFQKTISKKGELLGQFVGTFIQPNLSTDNFLFVVEDGNTPCISIFNPAFKFVKRIYLNQYIDYDYVPTLQSTSFVEKTDGVTKLFLSTNTTQYGFSSPDLYKRTSSVMELDLDKDFNVISKKRYLPYKNYPKIQSALAANKKDWDSPVAQIAADAPTKTKYVKYEFDDNLYAYDDNWHLIKTYAVSPPYATGGYSIPFNQGIRDQQKSTETDFKLRYANIYYYSMDIKDGKAFILYLKPLEADAIPKNQFEENKVVVTPVLHVIDLKTDKQFFVNLPVKLSPYSHVAALNSNEVMISGNSKINEDIQLYKIKLNYE
ncbi:hypothetical protein A0256_17610 [Mucilaginibacter sp. PAMC 26640]|nr:hypothetical protein A0256_17610 [Mucilaginibacter sp. PAMC 26640]